MSCLAALLLEASIWGHAERAHEHPLHCLALYARHVHFCLVNQVWHLWVCALGVTKSQAGLRPEAAGAEALIGGALLEVVRLLLYYLAGTFQNFGETLSLEAQQPAA